MNQQQKPPLFQNPPGSPVKVTDKKRFRSFLWERIIKPQEPVEVPQGHVLPEAEALEQLQALNGQDSHTWLGHASHLIRLSGTWILCDPYLGKHASPLPPLGPKRFAGPSLTVKSLPDPDVIVISHNHYDHLDKWTLKRLAKRRPQAKVFVPLKQAKLLQKFGFRDVEELDWHDSRTVGGATITFLPAVHWSRRRWKDRNHALWGSYLLQGTSGRRVWFSGDTAYGPVYKTLGEQYGPIDLALVPIGAYEPQWIMKASHANPEEGVQIGVDLKASCLMGHHWGTIRLTDEPPFEPPDRYRLAAEKAGYTEDRTWLMKIGESRALPAQESD